MNRGRSRTRHVDAYVGRAGPGSLAASLQAKDPAVGHGESAGRVILLVLPIGTQKGITHHGRERTVREGPSGAAGCPGC